MMLNTLSKLKKYLPARRSSYAGGIPIAVGLGLFALGFILGSSTSSTLLGTNWLITGGPDQSEELHKKCHSDFQLINADAVCDSPAVIKKTGYAKTQSELAALIEDAKAAGQVTGVSVYFRDLENGPIFGINETDEFAPASLLKLPLALVYLTQAERTPELLSEQLSVAEPQWHFTETFPPKEKIDPTKPHTVEELLLRMLAYSDNNAYGVLQTHLFESGQKDLIPQTFLELGFIDPSNVYNEVLSVRRYGAIFRGLYNASYLNAELSEKVLDFMARSDFTLGLAGGVPAGIVISHKFGERDMEDGTKQLHDCGIVYYPDNPYLLCIMTRGKDFAQLLTVISHISGMVYNEVDARKIR